MRFFSGLLAILLPAMMALSVSANAQPGPLSQRWCGYVLSTGR
jgi:hypothetical protein